MSEHDNQAIFAQRWLTGMFLFMIILFFFRVWHIKPDPPRKLVVDRLVASPSDPYMIEALRIAQARRSDDGPWGGAQRKNGPKVTIQMPGGPMTLTQEELGNANFIYPQLKARQNRSN